MPAHLDLPDLLVNLVRTEMLAPTERKANPVSPAMLLQLQPAPMVDAASAPTDPKAQLDPLDLPDPPAHLVDLDLLENPELPANPAQLDQLDHQDLPAPMANPDPRELQVPPALVAAKANPDPKAPLAKMVPLALLVLPARKEPTANLVPKVPLDPPDHLAQPDLLARMAPLDPRDLPGPMPSTAPAPNELGALLWPSSKRIVSTITSSLEYENYINTGQLSLVTFLHFFPSFCLSLKQSRLQFSPVTIKF